MGRHSSPSQWHFYRSVAGWVVPWFLVASIAGAAVWIGVDALGAGTRGKPPGQPAPPAAVSAGPTDLADSSPSPEAKAKPRRAPRPKPSPSPRPLIAQGVTVQVLNGTGVADANDRVAERLEKLGYTIVNLEGANRAYSQTTVFWSYPDAKADAVALARHFGWTSGPRPENLSTQVDLHIVVGADEA